MFIEKIIYKNFEVMSKTLNTYIQISHSNMTYFKCISTKYLKVK